MKFKLLLASAALAAGLATTASATVLTFEDLAGSGDLNNYAGISWGALWTYYSVANNPYNPSSGIERIYAKFGHGEDLDPAPFTFATPVVFDGAYFAGYGSAEHGSTVAFELFLGGVSVGLSGVLDPSSTPTFLASGYGGLVDEVHVLGDHGAYVMDDVTFAYRQSTAPEPATWALMIGGLGLTGAALRRRKLVAR